MIGPYEDRDEVGWVQEWYEGLGFKQIDSYLHVYVHAD